jgi:uncharacterized repeat protein (TIGR01451 family)
LARCSVLIIAAMALPVDAATPAIGVAAPACRCQAAADYDPAVSSDYIATGDLNGDGKLDVVTAGFFESRVSVLLNDGHGGFLPAAQYDAGSTTWALAVGDFNGDGKLDLVTSMAILLGNGDGSFQPPIDYWSPPGSVAGFLAVSDFNGDGKLDLAVSSYEMGSLFILIGNGDGTFQTTLENTLSGHPSALAVADFDQDGKPDLAVGNAVGISPSGHVSILLGNGDGTFRAGVERAADPQVVATGDFNGDGNPDLFMFAASSGKSILLGKGNGDFQAPVPIAALIGGDLTSLVVGDLNGDGSDDLATADVLFNAVHVYLANGDGTFRPAVSYAAGDGPWSLAVGDFDGDGQPDVAVANSGSASAPNLGFSSVSILLGSGNGTFWGAVSYPVGYDPLSVAAGDFNGDGRTDLAVTHYSSQTLSILLARADGTFPPAVNYPLPDRPFSTVPVEVRDLNGDGKLDLVLGTGRFLILLGNGDGTFRAPVAYDAGNGTTGIAVGDVNRDGHPDLVAVAARYDDVDGLVDGLAVLLGNGDGTLQAPTRYRIAPGTTSVAIGDFDGDGNPDLALSGQGVAILRGTGNGSFPYAAIAVTAASVRSIRVADLDADGRADLILGRYYTVEILLGNGNGTFQPAVDYSGPQGNPPGAVAVGDFNHDGIADLAVALIYSGRVWILLGNGNGTFQPGITHGVGYYPASIAVGDFNGDGTPDLAVANAGSHDVSILLNICKLVPDATVTSSRNPSLLGEAVTFTANLTRAGGGGAPSGLVTFKAGAMALGTVPLAGGSATLTSSSLSGGHQMVRVVYGGDGAFTGVTSAPLDQIVNPADLSISNTDGQATAVPGSPITYTIVVSNTGPNPATGVTVTDAAPAAIANVTWTCVGSGGGTCVAGGAGSIVDTVNLPVGATATYTLTGTVAVSAPSPLSNTATVMAPSNLGDTNLANNTATDVDMVPFDCASAMVVVADGRLTQGLMPPSGTLRFGASIRIGGSYSVEFRNDTGSNTPPGTLTAFTADDRCTGNSTRIVEDTSGIDPAGTNGIARARFQAAGDERYFRGILVNGSGSPIPFTFSLSDTTMYSAAWSTNGSFDTYYSLLNTTGAGLVATLTLFDTAGATVATIPLSIPAGRTASANTSSLSVTRGKTGTARLTHDGPPGAIVAEAAIANFTISPAYVQPVKLQAVREAR